MYFGGRTCNYVMNKKEKNKLKQKRSSSSNAESPTKAPPKVNAASLGATTSLTSSSSPLGEHNAGQHSPSISAIATSPESQQQQYDASSSPREITTGAFAVAKKPTYSATPVATSSNSKHAPLSSSIVQQDGYPVQERDLEIRRQIENLVKLVAPDTVDKVDELYAKFHGKEEELLETLQLMERKLKHQIRMGGGGGVQNPPITTRTQQQHQPMQATTAQYASTTYNNNMPNGNSRVSFHEGNRYGAEQQGIGPPRNDTLHFADVQENPFEDFEPNEV